MSSAVPPLHRLLHGLVLRLALVLGGVLAGVLRGRMYWLRVRLAAMPAGQARRRMERELGRMARALAAMEDPAFWEDPRTAGKAAEVARCRADAGRRALPRRMGLLCFWGRGMRCVAGAAPLPLDELARCTTIRHVA